MANTNIIQTPEKENCKKCNKKIVIEAPPTWGYCLCKEEEEEEEEEFEYCAYSLEKMFKVRICVAGGGLMNGNANAYIEGEWKTEEEFNDGEDGEIYYCEYGKNPSREYVGSRIIWGECDNFMIIPQILF